MVVVLEADAVAATINPFFERDELRELPAKFCRAQRGVTFFQRSKKFCRYIFSRSAIEFAARDLQHGRHDGELDRGGLHARGTGDGHRPGGEIHLFDARFLDHFAAALDVFAENFIRVVVDEINFRSRLQPRPRRADDKGRLATLGDGKHHILRTDAEVVDLLAAKLGEIFEALNGFDERVIAARHHAERAVFQICVLLQLPEIAPDGIEHDAQPAGRTAAGEENFSARFDSLDHFSGDFLRAAGRGELAEFFHHVVVGLKQQVERGGNILARHAAQIGRHGMG